MEEWQSLVYTVEDGYLSLCGQDLERLPSFKDKKDKHNNFLTNTVTTLDVSANRLRFFSNCTNQN
jgi:hypothetical protein